MHVVKWELWLAGVAKLAGLAVQFCKLLDEPHNGQETFTCSSICSRLISIDVKHQEQKQFREERVYFLFQVSARPRGEPRQNLEEETTEETRLWDYLLTQVQLPCL